MTNKEAANAARRIEFQPDWPASHPKVANALTRIVNRQVNRSQSPNRFMRKDLLRVATGDIYGAKAPGHDAAVKAARARKQDEYSVLGATDEQSWNNYLQDCRRRG